MSNNYRNLLVWQKAKTLAINVYRVTEQFPRSEIFGLTNQMRRAGVSVPSNIAEGQGRGTRPDFSKYLCIARGSLQELETQIDIAMELKLGKAEELAKLHEDCFQILGLLNRLLKAIESKARA
ncbi:MAG TPA: four helix bundle protein [Candidatus Saccharimonadales bacterium]|nr:four helix bundle protein [Candidatus Saccharimonadales bacterium]